LVKTKKTKKERAAVGDAGIVSVSGMSEREGGRGKKRRR
jgi:hypothetical protein